MSRHWRDRLRRRRLPILTRAAPHLPATHLVGSGSLLVRKLTEAYWAEVESAVTYLASSTNRDGIRARRISEGLREVITSNLDHAHRLALRIRQLHGPAPGPDDFLARQFVLRPPAPPDEHISVLEEVFATETAAIDRYRGIVAVASEAADWVTQDLARQLIRDKESHRQWLRAYLADSPSGASFGRI